MKIINSVDSRSGKKGYCALITLSFFNLHSSFFICGLAHSPKGGAGGGFCCSLSNSLTTVFCPLTSSVVFGPSDDSLTTVCEAFDFQILSKDTTATLRSTNRGGKFSKKKFRACEFVTGDFVTISTCHTAETGIIRFMIIYNIIIKILLQLFSPFQTTLMSQRHMSQCLICSTTRRMAPKRVFFSKRVH